MGSLFNNAKRPGEVPNPWRIFIRKLAIASPGWALGPIASLNRLLFGKSELCPPFIEYSNPSDWRTFSQKVKGAAGHFALTYLPVWLQHKLLERWPRLGSIRRELGFRQRDSTLVTTQPGEELYKGLHAFDKALYESLPRTKEGQRSVVFLNHSYYHHYYLARALRKRGWNAISIVSEDPSSSSSNFYHGEDVSIWDADSTILRKRCYSLMRYVEENARMLFWHNENCSSIFHECYQNAGRDRTPWDLIYLKHRGVKLGVSMSGCLTGTGQTEFNEYTGGVCDTCVWQDNPEVCSDPKNLAIGEMYENLADLYAIEGDWVVNQSRKTDRAFREPLTFCLDHEIWRPDLEVPVDKKFEKEDGEILIFHAVGNYVSRDDKGRNIKGTPAVLDAVDRLKAEGYPVKLVFVHDVHSKDMKYYQVQADIVVDQIIYGRYGAASRESMMLGKPTITKLVREQPLEVGPSQSLEECPLIDANTETVYDVLKRLVLDPEERERIGRASREYAIKWHSADACAARFERVYDRMLSGDHRLDVLETYHG